MNHYYSTFISGFQKLIEAELKRKLPDLKINRLLDGLVIYQTTATFREIQKLKFFNNSFILLSQLKCSKDQVPESIIDRLLQTSDFKQVSEVSKLQFIKSFRLIISKENQTISLKQEVLKDAENIVSKQTRLKLHKTLPDIEFWFNIRDENICLFGARITPLGKTKTKKYQKGELRQELAHLLILMSDPDKDDVVLEPFAGFGAIVLERVQSFPYKRIYASDIDRQRFEELKRKTKWGQPKIIVVNENAFSLPSVPDNSIDKIITDPPWGEYGPPLPSQIALFNQEMLKSFDRVLKRDGIVVTLLSRNINFNSVVKKSKFKILKQIDILVSGKKASAYKLFKQ